MPRRDDGTGARVLPRESLGPMTARPAATRTASRSAVGLAPRRLALAWSAASTCMLDRASAGPALERVPPACTDRWSIGSGVERAPLACSDRPSLRSPLDCVLFPHSTAPRLAVPVCCSPAGLLEDLPSQVPLERPLPSAARPRPLECRSSRPGCLLLVRRSGGRALGSVAQGAACLRSGGHARVAKAECDSTITGRTAPPAVAQVAVRPGCPTRELVVMLGPWCSAVLVVRVKTKATRGSNRGPFLSGPRLYPLDY